MRLSKEQEAGSSMEDRVTRLERVAVHHDQVNDATGGVLKALENMINARGEVSDARCDSLEKKIGSTTDLIISLGDLVKAQGNMIQAQDNMIDALTKQVRAHGDVIKEILSRI